MSTHDTVPDLEERLRAALTARAELVQPEDLDAGSTPVVPLRPAWRSPWALLATAAVVLLVLGVVVQGVGGRERSDRLAPQPGPTIQLPEDVGRDWEPDAETTPARLDLDGDGTRERVEFLAEPTPGHDGRTRVQTTLSSTGEEAFGVVELGTTIGTTALDPIDADTDGDQELVLSTTAVDGGPGAPFEPVVLDLRDGLLVQAVPEDPELLAAGDLPVVGSETTYYDRVHVQTFAVEDSTLVSTRSVSSFARADGAMTLLQPETYVVDTFVWTLDARGVLRPEEQGCRVQVPEATRPCDAGSADDLPYVTSESTETVGVGEETTLDDGGLGYRVRVDDDGGGQGSLVVDGPGADTAFYALNVTDPQVHVVSPGYLTGYDAASLVVSSASDPSAWEVVVQTADQAGLVQVRPVGDIPLGTGTTDGRDHRTWLTASGVLVTVVAQEDDSWEAWQWVRVGEQQIAALPWGLVCFDDVEDPTTGRAC